MTLTRSLVRPLSCSITRSMRYSADLLEDWAASQLGGIEPYHYWDFIDNRALFAGVDVGPLASTPGWSYTRADSQSAYAQDSTGLLVPFATGVLRRTDKGVLSEGARTNRCLRSRDLTNAAWTKTNATAALDQTGADGGANSASSLTATAGNATCLQAITNASVARYFSIWVKRITGTGNIQVTLDNGTGWTTVTVTSAWTRVGATQTLANPTVGIRIVTSGDAIAVDFCQEETGAFPSSPIPTTSASATRAADVITVPVALSAPYSLFVEFEEQSQPSGADLIGFDTLVNGAGVYVSTNSPPRSWVREANVTTANVVAGGTNLSTATTYKSAHRFALNDVQAARGGTLGTADTGVSPPATTSFIFGGAVFGGKGYNFIRKAAIFNSALSNAQLQAMTT